MYNLSIGNFSLCSDLVMKDLEVVGSSINLRGSTPYPLKHYVEETLSYFGSIGVEIVLVVSKSGYEVYLNMNTTNLEESPGGVKASMGDKEVTITSYIEEATLLPTSLKISS